MKSINSILIVVDPTVERDFCVDRAKSILTIKKASVRFFINCSNSLSQQSYAYEGIDSHFIEKQRLLFTEHYKKILFKLVEEFGKAGIEASSVFSEEHNLAESIIAQVNEYKPDLLIKSTHHHALLTKTLISNTDWRLIRKCPCPILLAKARPWRGNGSIVAAVDPLHVKAAQSRLDHLLVETAESIGAQFKLKAKVFHSYFPFVGSLVPNLAEASSQIEELRRKHQNKLNLLLADHTIPEENVAMAKGDLVPSLIHFLDESDANILVIGALSRNVLERAIVGNTAEKILDDCPCDVLVIKS